MATQFTNTTGEIFTVQEVLQVDQELWVYYNNVNTGEPYSCLLTAFADQFQPKEPQV
jgi:hypothetical protein